MSTIEPSSAGEDSGARKVAALLLAMGKPHATRVLKHFSENELRRVVETTATLGTVTRDRIERFTAEMISTLERGIDVRAGADNIETLLSGVVQPEQLASLLSAIRGDTKRSIWLRLAELPETSIYQFLGKEHPQVIALVLSKTPSHFAAAVLRHMPGALRAEVVRRILAVRPVTEAALTAIEQALEDELFVKVSKESGPPVHSRVADIINKMDQVQVEEVLTSLEQHRPQDAKLIKGLLFTFEDIARLSPADRVKLFDGVPAERTIVAMHDATQQMREIVLSSVSSRSRRMIEQEIAGAGNVSPREIAKARRAIADLALELAERGQIDIAQQQDEM